MNLSLALGGDIECKVPRSLQRAAIRARISRIQAKYPGRGIIPDHDLFATRSGQEQAS